MISSVAAGLMLLFFLFALYLTARYGMKRIDVSHEEIRRALAESNRRIDEERRILARRLHDEVNPQLLISKNALKQLEPLVKDNEKASALLASALEMVSDAYAQTRDIIKNTRIEVIDSVGFTAALESLVVYYTSFFDETAITLDHNLPKRPELPEAVAVSAYKIIREALFNAMKHANASQVRILVQYNKAFNQYKVDIADDGVGMKASAKNTENAGIGLIDMRERARALGGGLKVQVTDPVNAQRPGTRISFSFSGKSS
ncbi:sensor histidine kinase [Mycetohabitans endofungorum]|uniref:sensor histidine kinase n=1 Tax=Mycetohabitans endofungorum TaxID=417203 RepID=UPI002B0626C8|nr:ATP-binding protein [Mycetohabitans endofungorum]